MRRKAAASIVAFGSFVVPASAQQTIIYGDPNFQPQGQIFQPQQPFGNQPVYLDPNTGQPIQQQPGFGQPFPQPGFAQPQQQYQPQPQPGFGQPLPQPSYGQPLPQPQQPFGQSAPSQQVIAPQQPGSQGLAPQDNVPYYERAADTVAPVATDTAQPGSNIGIAPAIQPQGVTYGPPAPQTDPTGGSAVVARDRGPEMSEKLNDLIVVGERYRAASPGFLEDLKKLAEKYREPLPAAAFPVAVTPNLTDPTGIGIDPNLAAGDPALTDPNALDPTLTDPLGPDPLTAETGTNAQFASTSGAITTVEPLDPGSIATIVYLEDDFTDGEIEYNPPWRVRQGNWGIDPTYGLRAKAPADVSDKPIEPKELLKVLLDGGTPDDERASQPQAALIESQISIGNAFSLAARIVDHSGQGAAHFIMHQGGSDWLGYRLELRSGPQPVVVLTRRGSNGYKDITKVQAPSFTKGETHELRWARLSDGQMLVILNGRPIITSRDTVFREDWKGFAFFNAGGDVSIRAIRIAAPVER